LKLDLSRPTFTKPEPTTHAFAYLDETP